jgi:hypothetical protein
MGKLLVGYYGDDVYDHDNSVCEWGRTPIDDTNAEEMETKYVETLSELYNRKRICWFHVLVLEMDREGSKSTTVVAQYRPLRHRIVLNEAAKEDMKNLKIKPKQLLEVAQIHGLVPNPWNVVNVGDVINAVGAGQ